jgi:hypothetical protein
MTFQNQSKPEPDRKTLTLILATGCNQPETLPMKRKPIEQKNQDLETLLAETRLKP